MRRMGWMTIALALLALWAWQQRPLAPLHSTSPSVATPATPDIAGSPGQLPDEARATLQRIAQGGPFAHRQDGAVFQNREHRLPPRPQGYYREYTVETPGSGDRGARRIISGGDPPGEYFYSDDHYRSFHAVDATGATR